MKRIILPIIFFFTESIYFLFPTKASATWIKYADNPVLSYGLTGQFDSLAVGTPTVVHHGSVFIMWYQGTDGFTTKIGLADSPDGLHWNKISQINIDNSSDYYAQNNHDPEVIYDEGIYKMWYAASSADWHHMHIKYSTSSDGINWNTPVTVLSPSYLWESDHGVTAPSVIHDQSGYKMWYGADGFEGGYTQWKIGFATSSNGIDWQKNLTPILVSDQPWEGGNVTGPTVIYDNGKYEMWYHGNTSIGHATSSYGIQWNKDLTNPVFQPEQIFNESRIHNPFLLMQDGIHKIWYIADPGNGRWQINYAQDQPFITPIPTTPISPTPTFTPSPTPSGPDPIVLIPGMGASWNRNDIFSCNVSQSGDWTMAPYVNVYNRLIKTFTDKAGFKLNQDFFVYTYDWRQKMFDAGPRLKSYIDNTVLKDKPYNRVNIVAHSLGGLVARSYIQGSPSHRVNKLVTLGSPHQGTVVTYPLWENGEIWTSDLLEKVAINSAINICRLNGTNKPSTKREAIHKIAPSVKDLLPTFDFLIKNGVLVSTNLIEGENEWLKQNNNTFTSPFYNINLLTISGNNHETLEKLDIRDQTAKDANLNNWIDGEPVNKNTITQGDGTILNMSSTISGLSDSVDTDHIGLVQETDSIQKVLNFLALAVTPAAKIVSPEVANQSSLIIAIDIPAILNLSDMQNNILQTSDKGIIVEYENKPSVYKFIIKPTKSGEARFEIGQTGMSDAWKEYKLSVQEGVERRFLIKYNPQNPHKEPVVEL